MYFSAYLDPFSTYIVQHSKEIKVLHKVTKYILTIDKKNTRIFNFNCAKPNMNSIPTFGLC